MKKNWLILLALGFVLNTHSAELKLNVKKGMNLYGTITSHQKQPIPGVVVSDGYSVAVTDNNGIYQMKKNPEARFVFYTIPANCKVNMQEGMPYFFEKIDTTKQTNRIDFTTELFAQPETDFTLLGLGDLQPRTQENFERLQQETFPDLLQFKQKTSTPIYAFALGDLCWDAHQFYAPLRKAISQLGITVFPVIGNHDHDKEIIDNDKKASGKYEETFGPTYYSVDRGKIHFIVLDNIFYTERSKYRTEITPNQLEWLKKDLQHVSKDKLVILCMHAPIGGKKERRDKLDNAQELIDIVKEYNTYLFAGHMHVLKHRSPAPRMEEYTQGAACGALWSGNICIDGSPAGYKVYEIKKGAIVNEYYKGTGKDKEYQMKLYAPGVSPDHPEAVVINIWNWNNHWNVRCFEDGVEKPDMKQFTGYDCDAYTLMFGADKPADRKSLEPSKTNHLFYYVPSKEAKEIKIEATDRYKNKYVETLRLK